MLSLQRVEELWPPRHLRGKLEQGALHDAGACERFNDLRKKVL